MNKQDQTLRFSNLSKFDSLIHGFSTRFFGDMKPGRDGYHDSVEKFAKALGIDQKTLVKMHQVHGDTVSWVTEKERGQTMPEADGLVTQNQQVFLSVITADCIPLLLYDPQKKYVAAVHAGWRGLFSEIIKNAVKEMVEKGSKPEDIIAGIGPCIRSCCYDIAQEHKEKLLAKFPEWKKFLEEREGKIFLDIAGIATSQLQSMGVASENIEDGDYCTFMHEDVYSCRREGKEKFGEIMGIIGIFVL